MRIKVGYVLRIILGVALGVVLMTGVTNAQSPPAPTSSPNAQATKPKKAGETNPTSATVGEDAGDYTITSTIELGYRGLRVDGDVNKYKSDLNYKAGPRLFDTTFLMKSRDRKSVV